MITLKKWNHITKVAIKKNKNGWIQENGTGWCKDVTWPDTNISVKIRSGLQQIHQAISPDANLLVFYKCSGNSYDYYVIWSFYLYHSFLILTGAYFSIRPSAYCVASSYPNVAWCQSTRAPKTHTHQPSHQICAWAWRCSLRLLPYFCNKIGQFYTFFNKKLHK